MREHQNSGQFNEAGPNLNEITLTQENDSLKAKLKSAAKYISHLIQEKEHLIEMSNQLRGELNRIKCKLSFKFEFFLFKL